MAENNIDGRYKKRCPNCNGKLHTLTTIIEKGIYMNPDLKYCSECDKVFKVFYIEEQVEQIIVKSMVKE